MTGQCSPTPCSPQPSSHISLLRSPPESVRRRPTFGSPRPQVECVMAAEARPQTSVVRAMPRSCSVVPHASASHATRPRTSAPAGESNSQGNQGSGIGPRQARGHDAANGPAPVACVAAHSLTTNAHTHASAPHSRSTHGSGTPRAIYCRNPPPHTSPSTARRAHKHRLTGDKPPGLPRPYA